jgi:hypothetical protein
VGWVLGVEVEVVVVEVAGHDEDEAEDEEDAGDDAGGEGDDEGEHGWRLVGWWWDGRGGRDALR